jgi:hypothetical protein
MSLQADLARAKAAFQMRSICAVLGLPAAGEVPCEDVPAGPACHGRAGHECLSPLGCATASRCLDVFGHDAPLWVPEPDQDAQASCARQERLMVNGFACSGEAGAGESGLEGPSAEARPDPDRLTKPAPANFESG